jgi:hypothetical protein
MVGCDFSAEAATVVLAGLVAVVAELVGSVGVLLVALFGVVVWLSGVAVGCDSLVWPVCCSICFLAASFNASPKLNATLFMLTPANTLVSMADISKFFLNVIVLVRLILSLLLLLLN